MTIGTHSIFVDDEDKSEPVSNDVAENPPESTVISDPTRQTSEVVQESQGIVEEASQPIQDTLE